MIFVQYLGSPTGDMVLIPRSGRSPGEGNGNPLQYSCLNSMDRGAWWATVHGVTKESHMTKQLSVHTHIFKWKSRSFQ